MEQQPKKLSVEHLEQLVAELSKEVGGIRTESISREIKIRELQQQLQTVSKAYLALKEKYEPEEKEIEEVEVVEK